MRHSTGKPTKYEQQRFDAMLRLGCVCCAQLGLWNIAVDIHHIVDGKRLGHWYTLPVCPGHHRGAWDSDQVEAIPPDLRIALSDGSKLFEKQYGTERNLWMKVQDRLRLPAVWPTSKIVPRRGYGPTERPVYLPPTVDPAEVVRSTDVLPLHEAASLRDVVSAVACAQGSGDLQDAAALDTGAAAEVGVR